MPSKSDDSRFITSISLSGTPSALSFSTNWARRVDLPHLLTPVSTLTCPLSSRNASSSDMYIGRSITL
ncbi:hypothetical protein PAA26_04250 [Methanomassiliicoccaceae archaeon COG_1]|nr:hypothetical protein [Methanomassiliicoccaceae archaeon COG_1]